MIVARFPLGRIVATAGAMALAGDGARFFFSRLVQRHASCDWGELSDGDKRANDHALVTGGRLLSAYNVQMPDGVRRFYVLTEADRSATTVLLPEEY